MTAKNNASCISFCTTCMNRLEYFKKTFFKNYKAASENLKNFEFVLVDYGSTDELSDYIRTNIFIKKLIKNKKFKLVRVEAKYFKEANSKNIAHYYSSGDIVVNVDVDTFIDKRYIVELLKIKHNEFLTTITKINDVAGRIAMFKDNFIKLGGYNENKKNIVTRSFIDSDLKLRAEKSGIKKVIYDHKFIKFLYNTNKERNQNYEAASNSYTDNEITDKNAERDTLECLKNNKLIAKPTGLKQDIIINFKDKNEYRGIHTK